METHNPENLAEKVVQTIEAIQGNDRVVLNGLIQKYGFTGVLHYIQLDLGNEQDTARVLDDGEVSYIFMKLKNRVRRLILGFQKEMIQ